MIKPDDTFSWELSFQQADLLLNCLNEARKADDLPLARLAFGFIQSLIDTAQAAKKMQEMAAAESTKQAEMPRAPNGHAQSPPA